MIDPCLYMLQFSLRKNKNVSIVVCLGSSSQLLRICVVGFNLWFVLNSVLVGLMVSVKLGNLYAHFCKKVSEKIDIYG